MRNMYLSLSGFSYEEVKSSVELVAALITIIGGPIAAYLAIKQLSQIKHELRLAPKVSAGFRIPGTSGIELENYIAINPTFEHSKHFSNSTPLAFTIMNVGNKTARGITWNVFTPNPVKIENGRPYDESWQVQVFPLGANKIQLNPSEELEIEVNIQVPRKYEKFKLQIRITMEDSPPKDHALWVEPQ